MLPFALLPLIGKELPRGQAWLAFISLPLALRLIYRFAREQRGPNFNAILIATVQLQMVFGLLLAVDFFFYFPRAA